MSNEYDDGPPISQRCNCRSDWAGEIGWTARLALLFALIYFLVKNGACP